MVQVNKTNSFDSGNAASSGEAPKAREKTPFKAFDDAFDSPDEQIKRQLSFESLTGQPTNEEREEGKLGAYVEKQRARSEALNEKRKAKIDFLTERNEDGTFKYSLSDMDEQAMPDKRLMHPEERRMGRGEGDEAITSRMDKRSGGSAAAMSTLEAANSAPVGPVAKPQAKTNKEGSLV